MTGKQLAPPWVVVRVGRTELGVPALPALRNNLGEWRLSVSFLEAIDSGLFPALLGFWPVGRKLDVFILQHNNHLSSSG